MNMHHASEAVKDAIACALKGQFATAHDLLDHATELMTEPSKSARPMDFMDGYEKTSYTAHLTEIAA